MTSLRIEHRIIQAILIALGVAAAAIGAMVFLMGVPFIQLTETAFNTITGQSIPVDPVTISPTIDNELRFYAVFWLSYGLLLVWVARNIVAQVRLVPILMGMFFLGGIGRAISHTFIEPPHPAFVVLMAIELLVPVLVGILYLRIRKL